MLSASSKAVGNAAQLQRQAAEATPTNRHRLPVTLGVTEPFVTTFTVAGYAALLLSLPLLSSIRPISSYICRSNRSGLREVDEGVQEPDAFLPEKVAFFDEGGFDGGRRGRHGGAGSAGLPCERGAGEAVDHREENDVERLLGVRAGYSRL